jgi:hypothetical protein
MRHFFQESSRLRGWILSALFGLMSWAAFLAACDASPANSPPGSTARADALIRRQDSPMGAQAPTPDLLHGEPDHDTAYSPGTQRPRFGPRPGESELGPIILTRKRREELLKSDFEKMKRAAAELATLAQSLQEDLDKSNEHILSMKIVEKAQKIENLAKDISRTAKSY